MLVLWTAASSSNLRPRRSRSKRRFFDGHDRKVDGSTPTQLTQALLLHPWLRYFTTIRLVWWNLPRS